MEATASTLLRPLARRFFLASSSVAGRGPAPPPQQQQPQPPRVATLLPQTQTRHKASTARTKRALNIPPHPSFLSAAAAAVAAAEAGAAHDADTIVFNPPASAPSVYHTPFKFLPRSDPRRRANLASLFDSHFGSSPDAKAMESLPILAEHKVSDRGPLTREEVEEMRALRTGDPHKWTVRVLSQKYDLPVGFIMACCQAPREKIEFERRKLELIRQRWGPARRKAREERARRRAMLFRGEL